MKLITPEDFRDGYIKIAQRGYKFFASKFSFSSANRTRSSFNDAGIESSNWWIVPMVRERWNFRKTGNSATSYEEYISAKFSGDTALKLISIGSGICSHELKFARLNPHWEVTCVDFSEKLLQAAEVMAQQEGLTNLKFLPVDVYTHPFPDNYYDIVLFNASLHHFKNMNDFIGKVHNMLVKNGQLIIDEYVGANRLQYSRQQLNAINRCLGLMDKEYRQIFKTNLYKNSYYGSGVIRMLLSDPSECVESEQILPSIHRHFRVVEEKGYGGNLLMPVLKDLSHHFVVLNESNKKCLERVFEAEDEYLKHNTSDFVFGLYEKIN
jgi:ubiquinone/menaquinone biosynthesis C-methylase UbiE